MGYYTYTKDPIGNFIEKDHGNNFEYSLNPDSMVFCEDHPHIIWVGGQGIAGMTGYRYAWVKKTVAYVVVDENDWGEAVVEKWDIKNHRRYTI